MKPPTIVGLAALLVMTTATALWLVRERDGGEDFPALLQPSAPLELFENQKVGIDGAASRRLCLLEGEQQARSAIQALARQYPHGWRTASRFVDFAPTHIATTGDSRILLLKNGLVIEAHSGANRTQRVVHSLRDGDAELIVRAICSVAK